MHDGGVQWGDVGTWVGGLGTWFVGIAAAAIAGRQYLQSRFRPTVKALYDGDHRIAVQIVNEASGNGVVREISLLPPDHPRSRVWLYFWEIDGKKDDVQRPLPFDLPGLASAQLVLVPEQDISDQGIRVRVDYGNGKDSGCIRIIPTAGHVYGSTYIPGRQ